MRILLDQGTPSPLGQTLFGHDVRTAYEQGWAKLTNGELLSSAEVAGFDLLITTDQNLRYQQNLENRKIAIVVLLTTSWPRIRNHVEVINDAIENCVTGTYIEVAVP
jgi:hypothetical protein